MLYLRYIPGTGSQVHLDNYTGTPVSGGNSPQVVVRGQAGPPNRGRELEVPRPSTEVAPRRVTGSIDLHFVHRLNEKIKEIRAR